MHTYKREFKSLDMSGHQTCYICLEGTDCPEQAVYIGALSPEPQQAESMARFARDAQRLGLDIDIVAPAASLGGYALVVVPCQPILTADFAARLDASGASVVVGAASGGKTEHFAIPDTLPPGPLQAVLPIKVSRVETLRGTPCAWIEQIETELREVSPGVFASGRFHYLARYPAEAERDALLLRLAQAAGLEPHPLPEGLRLRRTANLVFAFNYAATAQALPAGLIEQPLLGGAMLEPAGVAIGARG